MERKIMNERFYSGRGWPVALLSVMLCTGACTGSLGGGGGKNGDGDGDGDDGKGGKGGSGDGGSSGGDTTLAACAPGSDGLTLRRLTRDEYDNTLKDLLGDVGSPGRSFPADITSLGFDNNVSTLTLPPVLTEQYEATAEKVIGDVWAREAMVPAGSRRIRVCEPMAGKEADCGRRVLEAFMPRAWRRPVTADEVTRMLGALAVAKAEGGSAEEGIKLSLQAVLMSPHFLFRIEKDANPKTLTGQYALASRLSYFLWGTMPDDELFNLAAQQKLGDAAVLREQAKRMLRDPKAKALVDLFAGQWLNLRVVESANPDSKIFPEIKPSLKQAMRAETERFFTAFVQEDLSALDILDANFSFMNRELAQHYGLAELNVTSDAISRVQLPASSNRRGLFGHGSFLMLTSKPDRTSIIKRGDWVLHQLTCEPPPAPPPNVPPLMGAGDGPTPTTVRERTEQHRVNPACASCHDIIDPIGFGLENFDAVGRWRDKEEGGGAIDARGTYKGTDFNGPKELAAAIKADPAFASCMVEKFYSYALGKSRGDDDEQTLDALIASFAKNGHRLSDLIGSLVTHPRFLSPCGS